MHASYYYKKSQGCNHPKQADLNGRNKKKSQGIILAISCTNKAHASKQDDFFVCAKVWQTLLPKWEVIHIDKMSCLF